MNTNVFELDRDGAWLSAYVDGELEPADVARVESWLAGSEEARREVTRLRDLNALTASLALREAPAEAWEVFWKAPAHRVERRVGWVLLAAGAVVVGGWAMWQAVAAVWRAADTPLLLKFGIYAAGAGIAVLLVSVVRERIYTRARTRYKDVVR
jgi:anti-sigma factor RsiW